MQSIAHRIATSNEDLYSLYQLNTEFTFTFWFVYLSRPWVFPICLTMWYWIRLTNFRKSNEWVWLYILKWWRNFDRKSKTFIKTCNVIFFGGLTAYYTRNSNLNILWRGADCRGIAISINIYSPFLKIYTYIVVYWFNREIEWFKIRNVMEKWKEVPKSRNQSNF